MKELFCTFEDCGQVADIRGRELCRRHYGYLSKRGLLPDLGECIEDPCTRKANFRGLCIAHRWVHFPEYFKRFSNASKGVNVDDNGDKRACSTPECHNSAHCKGLCDRHYTASRRPEYLSPNRDENGNVKTCSASEGCDKQAISKGLCGKHWERVRKSGSDVLEDPMSPCPVPGCTKLKKHTRTPLCKKCTAFRNRYSLSVERVIEIFNPANRVCGNPGCRSTERLHMDHDHVCCPPGKLHGRAVSCGKCIRGWLCHGCNTSLGMLQENPRRIQGLLDYLNVTTAL